MPGRELQLVAGDARAGHHADHARLDAEVGERLDQLAGQPLVILAAAAAGALLRLRMPGRGQPVLDRRPRGHGVQRQLLGRLVEPDLRGHRLVGGYVVLELGAGSGIRRRRPRRPAPRAATRARRPGSRTRGRRRTGRRTPGCRPAAPGLLRPLPAPPGTAVSVGRAGRPLAVAPGHLAAQARARAGGARRPCSPGAAHQHADRGAGQQHDRRPGCRARSGWTPRRRPPAARAACAHRRRSARRAARPRPCRWSRARAPAWPSQ